LAAGISRSSDHLSALIATLVLFLILDLYLMDVVDALIGAIDFGLLALLCWLLRARIVFILGIGSLAFAVSVALTAQPLDPPEWSMAQATKPHSELPPVVHVILDEHCGTDCFPAEVMSDSARATAQQAYVNRGFAVWTGVMSTDHASRLSLTAMMNPSTASPETLQGRSSGGFEYALTKNEYFEQMTSAGYRIRVLQNSYLNFCPPLQPENIECRTYQHNSAGILRYLDLSLNERFVLLAGLADWSAQHGNDTIVYRQLLNTRLGVAVKHWQTTNAHRRLQPLVAQRALARVASDLATASPGNVYVAHLLIPHQPYIFDENCQVLTVEKWTDLQEPSTLITESSRRERYFRYKAQVTCTDQMVTALLDGLAANEHLQNAIIILHGDHGSRIGPTLYSRISPQYEPSDHKRDFYSAFFAVHLPAGRPGVKDFDLLLPEAFWSVIGPLAGMPDDRAGAAK